MTKYIDINNFKCVNLRKLSSILNIRYFKHFFYHKGKTKKKKLLNQFSLSIANTSFIQGETSFPNKNVRCPETYILKKLCAVGSRDFHKNSTSTGSASKSEVPANNRTGTLILPKS